MNDIQFLTVDVKVWYWDGDVIVVVEVHDM